MAEGRLWYMEERIEIGEAGLPWPSTMQVQPLVEELKYLQAVNRSPTKKGYLLLPNVQCKSG